MPANDSFQERTEKATPKRRSEAKEEGNVARSMEVNSAAVLLVGTMSLYFMATWILKRIQMGMVVSLRESSKIDIKIEDIDKLARLVLQFMFENAAPLAFIILIFGVAANILQVGFLFTLKPLQPKISKLNPVEGIKRLFSLRSFVELLKGILKITIVSFFAYQIIKIDYDKYYPLMDSDISTILPFIGGMMFRLVIKITLLLLIFAIADYAYQRWEYEKNLRMSKQEIKDEQRQSDGDPFVKRRIRGMQRQMVLNAMIQELPEADVVITNPVHLAVALKYDVATMESPKVVAKGARKLAERIKRIAEEHDIPIVENKELARALYKSVDVGSQVPSKFYQAVAEVLSYVYKLKNKIL